MDAFEGAVELLGGGGTALDLVEGFVEDLCDVEEADNIAFFVTNGLGGRWKNIVHEYTEPRQRDGLWTHEMPETPLDHQSQSFCSTGDVPSDHRVRCHDLTDVGRSRVESSSGDL